jgi:anti-anti-sigma regulatory factor
VSCTVDLVEDGSAVRVVVAGVVDTASARQLSGALASHVGVDEVDEIVVDLREAEVSTAATQVLSELARRFSGAGQRLVVRDEAPEGGPAAARR